MPGGDLIIRGGTVVDGTGEAPRHADVAVSDGVITEVGDVSANGRREIDATGLAVVPGFIDGHTHLDAQMFWDPLGTSSCWHGVTTVVTGNCGFTLAPSRPGAPELVLRNLERAEDIPAEALAEGIQDWSWEHVTELLDVVAALPKALNVAVNVGHSALRTWAMGERAFDGPATDDDLERMAVELRSGLAAGAIGFTTSRSDKHMTADGRPVASRLADWEEVVALVGVLGSAGPRVFELANESAMSSSDPAVRAEAMGRLADLTVTSGATTTFGVTSVGDPRRWQEQLQLLESVSAAGGRMFGQSNNRVSDVLFSFRSTTPFDRLAGWAEIRALTIDEQVSALEDPAIRSRLVAAARDAVAPPWGTAVEGRDLSNLFVFDDPLGPNPRLVEVAGERGVDPLELFVDQARSSGLDQLWSMVIGNADPAEVTAILEHPLTAPTFSDSGAHVSIGINASLPTNLLAHWVRRTSTFTVEEAVRRLSDLPARIWGLADRGRIAPGFRADINVIDLDEVRPLLPEVVHDLPGGARRLVQQAVGIRATLVGGEVTIEDGEPTGALPGVLIRA